MYLDPGFGSMIIQMVIAGIAVAGAYFFVVRTKIGAFFSRKRNSDAEHSDKEDDENS